MKRLLSTVAGLCVLLLSSPLAWSQYPAQSQNRSDFITSTQCVAVPSGNLTVGSYAIMGSWSGTLTAYGAVGQGAAVALQSQTSNGSYIVNIGGYTLFEVCGNNVSSGSAFVQVTASVLAGLSSAASFTATGSGPALTQVEVADPGAPGANTDSLYANSSYDRWVVYNHNSGPKVLGTWMVTSVGGLQLGGATQLNGINTEVLVAGNSSTTGFFQESSAGVGGWTPATDPTPVAITVERGRTLQKAETATADANVLTVVPAATIGSYRVCYDASVSSATSGVIGFTLSWTDSNGNAQANIALPLFQQGTAAPALTFTTSAAGNYGNCTTVEVNNAGASIVLKWIGGGTTAAKVSGFIECL